MTGWQYNWILKTTLYLLHVNLLFRIESAVRVIAEVSFLYDHMGGHLKHDIRHHYSFASNLYICSAWHGMYMTSLYTNTLYIWISVHCLCTWSYNCIRKGKISDQVVWDTPPYTQDIIKYGNTQTRHKNGLLHNGCGPTLDGQLEWHLPPNWCG